MSEGGRKVSPGSNQPLPTFFKDGTPILLARRLSDVTEAAVKSMRTQESSASSSSSSSNTTSSFSSHSTMSNYSASSTVDNDEFQTKDHVVTLFLREHEMLHQVRRLAYDLLSIPKHEKRSTVQEIKAIIGEYLKAWVGEKIETKLDKVADMRAFYQEIDQKMHTLAGDNFNENAIPAPILRRYEEQMAQRQKELAELDQDIDSLIRQLESTPANQKDTKNDIDHRIGELLLMRKFLYEYMENSKRNTTSVHIIHIYKIKEVYGCTIKPLQILTDPDAANTTKTISIQHEDYDPVVNRIFRDYIVQTDRIDLALLRANIAKELTDEYLLPKMVLGEKHIVQLFTHYMNLALEFLITPEQNRNQHVEKSFVENAARFISNPHLTEIKMEVDAWKTGFDRKEKESPDMRFKEFCFVANKRLAMAFQNLSYFEQGKVHNKIVDRYKAALVEAFVEIASLQNGRAGSSDRKHLFDKDLATKKAALSLKIVHMLNSGNFFAL